MSEAKQEWRHRATAEAIVHNWTRGPVDPIDAIVAALATAEQQGKEAGRATVFRGSLGLVQIVSRNEAAIRYRALGPIQIMASEHFADLYKPVVPLIAEECEPPSKPEGGSL